VGTPTLGQGYGCSFSPLDSPCSGGIFSLLSSPGGIVSRLIQANNNNNNNNNNIIYNNNNGNMSPLGGMAMTMSPFVPHHQHSFSMQPSSVPLLHQMSRRRRDSSTTTTASSVEPLAYGFQGMAGPPTIPLAVDTLRSTVSAMNTLVPRKKAPSSMQFGPGVLVP